MQPQSDELEREITAIDRHLLVEALELDALIRPKRDRRLMQEADDSLERWAKEYRSGDQVQIKKMTGWPFNSLLGKLYSKGSQTHAPIDDKAYQKLNGVVFSMSASGRATIQCHYLNRKLPIAQHIIKSGSSKSKYYRDLTSAKEEFIARGGID